MNDTNKFSKVLDGKKIPIVTLDHKWHKIFGITEKPKEISALEKELNELLKRQGKLTTESKDIKRLKSKLMNEIVSAMDESESDKENSKSKKNEENKRLITECNLKLEDYQDELLELPTQIDRKNEELMLKTMDICYSILQQNIEDIDQITKWIDQIRIDLKKNLVRKQEKELKNQELYSYMHDIFGAEVIEIFDLTEEIRRGESNESKSANQ